MFKSEEIITAKDGKFNFPDLGDAYKEAIMLTFIAIETVSVDYARIKMDPDKKVKKYSRDNLSKEMLDIQKEVLDKSTHLLNFLIRLFNLNFLMERLKESRANFSKKKLTNMLML